MNQRVRVDKFDGAGGMKRGRDITRENARRLDAEDGTDALATGEDAVAHGGMNRRRLSRGGREEPLKGGIDSDAVLFEKRGEFHR